MKPRRILKISLTDEARLQTLGSTTLTPMRIILISAGFLLLSLAMGYLLVVATPMKNLIPGYMGESQRIATEDALLRVDSIREAYLRNESWLSNFHDVLDTDRSPRQRQSTPAATALPAADSLLPPNPHESAFVRTMQEREKFNISIVAPMAAEGMLFYPVTEEGIVSGASRDSRIAEVIITQGASVMAVADGIVVAGYFDESSRAYTLLIQHDNGFVSKYSNLGSLFVEESENVLGGQILATPRPTAKVGSKTNVNVQLWHDGIPLKPYDYISSHHSYTSLPH